MMAMPILSAYESSVVLGRNSRNKCEMTLFADPVIEYSRNVFTPFLLQAGYKEKHYGICVTFTSNVNLKPHKSAPKFPRTYAQELAP